MSGAALVAGGNFSKLDEALETAAADPGAVQNSIVVVQANCPIIEFSDNASVRAVYARSVKEDASKLAYQSSFRRQHALMQRQRR